MFRASRKTGKEKFTLNAKELALSLGDFWRWSASDLVSNATRGVLAEFIVASALGLAGGVRNEWDSFDVKTKSGVRVEVKASAYIQSWHQDGPSRISFSIRPTLKWDPETNKTSGSRKRQPDVYVFCVHNHADRETIDPMNLKQWDFYVLATAILNENCPAQKSIGLRSLLKLNPCIAGYDEIASCIDAQLAKQA